MAHLLQDISACNRQKGHAHMRQLRGTKRGVSAQRRPRFSASLEDGSAPPSFTDRSLLKTCPTQIVWVQAAPASAKDLSARIRLDLSLAYEEGLRIATCCVSEKYTSFEDFVERTKEHPYLCFTTVGVWTKRVRGLVAERGKDLSDAVFSEWFWTLFRKVY
jgi:hypothetical protein